MWPDFFYSVLVFFHLNVIRTIKNKEMKQLGWYLGSNLVSDSNHAAKGPL